MNVTGSQVDVLARLLDVASMRHSVIAQNVSNINTPGYREQEVSFEDALLRHLQSGESTAKSFQGVNPQVVAGQGGAERTDGNNVDIDQEMAALTKNTLLYRTYAEVLGTQLTQMRLAIAGR